MIDYIVLSAIALAASGCAFVAGYSGWDILIRELHWYNAEPVKTWGPGQIISLITSVAFCAACGVYAFVRWS